MAVCLISVRLTLKVLIYLIKWPLFNFNLTGLQVKENNYVYSFFIHLGKFVPIFSPLHIDWKCLIFRHCSRYQPVEKLQILPKIKNRLQILDHFVPKSKNHIACSVGRQFCANFIRVLSFWIVWHVLTKILLLFQKHKTKTL